MAPASRRLRLSQGLIALVLFSLAGCAVSASVSNDASVQDGTAERKDAQGDAVDAPPVDAGDAAPIDATFVDAGDAAAGDAKDAAPVDAPPSDVRDGSPTDIGYETAPADAASDGTSNADATSSLDAATDAGPGAVLQANATTHDFSLVKVGAASATFLWTISNGGPGPTGALTLTTSSGEVTVVNNCPNVLNAAASCTITIGMTPSAGGTRSGSVTLAGAPGGTVRVNLGVVGGYTVTIQKSGGASAGVRSTPAGIDCGTSCERLFAGGASVTVNAVTTNGSGVFFTGWSGGGGCGSARDCSFTLNANLTLSAAFSPINYNLMFVSSRTYHDNLGGVAPYDAACNAVATAAGINDAAGTAYVAWVSSSASNAVARMGSSRGFVRTDGKPVADQLSDMLTNHKMFHTIGTDEYGQLFTTTTFPRVLTGTYDDGTTATGYNCDDFTGSGGYASGVPVRGSSFWSWGIIGTCSDTAEFALYCFMRTKNAALTPAIHSGKRIFMTTAAYTPSGGVTGANTLCNNERPAGVAKARAFISTTTQTAASALTMTATYVRLDGQIVGTGQQIASGAQLETGIWQKSDGSYLGDEWVFTGSPSPGNVGTAASTCNNWTLATSEAAEFGSAASVSSDFWNFHSPKSCATPRRLYCVEE